MERKLRGAGLGYLGGCCRSEGRLGARRSSMAPFLTPSPSLVAAALPVVLELEGHVEVSVSS